MTSAEAKQLKIGDRLVFLGGTEPLVGRVEWNGRALCTILWENGSRTITKHDRFERMEKLQGESK
jgi:hypothetical protein